MHMAEEGITEVDITEAITAVDITAVAIIEDGAGVGESGSALDGAGVGGLRGGVLRTIRTIHTMRHLLWLSSNRLRFMTSRLLSRTSRITGITVRNHKRIIHMSRNAQKAG
jgi:hypothetical protein